MKMSLDPCVRIGTVQVIWNDDVLEQPWWPKCVFLANILLKSHQRSYEATSRGLSITLDWKKINIGNGFIMFFSSRSLDWFAALPLLIITWPWPEVKFWPWPLPFKGQIIYLSKRLYERNTIMPLPILYLHYFKKYSWKNISPVTAILTICDLLRLNRWPEVTFDDKVIKRRVQKLSIGIICVLLAISSFSLHSSWHNGTFSETYNNIYRTLTFDDLWWPQYCSERKNDWNTFKSTYWELSNVFYASF